MRPPSPAEASAHAALCTPASTAEVDALRRDLELHLGELRQAARHDELLPVDLGALLAARLGALLASLDDLAPEHRPLVVGAARYFISDADVIPDRGSMLGLDDDLAIYNDVVLRIGRPDLGIDE